MNLIRVMPAKESEATWTVEKSKTGKTEMGSRWAATTGAVG